MIEDKTKDSEVSQRFRKEVMRICEKSNEEERGKNFKLLIESFEVKKKCGPL